MVNHIHVLFSFGQFWQQHILFIHLSMDAWFQKVVFQVLKPLRYWLKEPISLIKLFVNKRFEQQFLSKNRETATWYAALPSCNFHTSKCLSSEQTGLWITRFQHINVTDTVKIIPVSCECYSIGTAVLNVSPTWRISGDFTDEIPRQSHIQCKNILPNWSLGWY